MTLSPHDTTAAEAVLIWGAHPVFEKLIKRGSSANSEGSRRIRKDQRPARRTAVDIFAAPNETVSTPAVFDAGVQAEVHALAEPEEEVGATVALVDGRV